MRLPYLRDAKLTDEAGGLDMSIEQAYKQAPDMEPGDGEGQGDAGSGGVSAESIAHGEVMDFDPDSCDDSGSEASPGEAGRGEAGSEEAGKGTTPDPASAIQEQEQSWDQALETARQTDKAQRTEKDKGSMPNRLEYLIEAAHQSVIDWRTLLRRFMDSTSRHDSSWARPNRRFIHQGIYLPGNRSGVDGGDSVRRRYVREHGRWGTGADMG